MTKRQMTETTSTRRRILAVGFVAAIAAAAFVAVGAAFGFLSATTPTASTSGSAGTVTLSSNATSTCSAADLLPGQSAGPCTLAATYTGNSPAYLGLDVIVATKAGSGGTPLFNPSDSTNDLQISVRDDQSSSVTYVTGSTSFGAALASCPANLSIASGSTCYEVDDLLVSTTAFSSASPSDTFTTSVSIPTTSPSGYQGGSAQVVLLVHAASADNQSLTGCSAGAACPSVSWS